MAHFATNAARALTIESLTQLINLALIAVIAYIVVLLVRALRKYTKSGEARQEKQQIKKSLGQCLREHRTQCHMTQEFVAEHIGVSRQAVSKWENGSAEPSTSNLIALAKLYGVSAEALLGEIDK